MNREVPTYCGSHIRPDQQELLKRLGPDNHLYALLIALDGGLTEEHCEKKLRDDWNDVVLRQSSQFKAN